MAGATAFIGQLLGRFAENTLASQDAKAVQKIADRDLRLKMLLGLVGDKTQSPRARARGIEMYMGELGVKPNSPEGRMIGKSISDANKGSVAGMDMERDGVDDPSQGQGTPGQPPPVAPASVGTPPPVTVPIQTEQAFFDPYARPGGFPSSPSLEPVPPKPPKNPLDPSGFPIDITRPVISNPDGSFSTESTMGVNIDGREFNIPTIVNGKRVSVEEAIADFERRREAGWVFPNFATREEAKIAARERSSAIAKALAVPTGQEQEQASVGTPPPVPVSAQAEAPQETARGIPQVPQAPPPPAGDPSGYRPAWGLMTMPPERDEMARRKTQVTSRAKLEVEIEGIKQKSALLPKLKRQEMLANLNNAMADHKKVTGKELPEDVQLKILGILADKPEAKVFSSMSSGEDLMWMKNPDGTPALDMTSQPFQRDKYYNVLRDKQGNYIGAMPGVYEPKHQKRQIRIVATDLGGSWNLQPYNDDGTPKGDPIVLKKGMTPTQLATLDPGTQEAILDKYARGLSAYGGFGWGQVPAKLRPYVVDYALREGIVILTPKEKETRAALDKTESLIEEVWDTLIGTKRKEDGKKYASVDEFLRIMDQYKVDHDGNLPEGWVGFGQRVGGLYEKGKGVLGFESGAVVAVTAMRTQLGTLLARAFGDVGNIAVTEREAASAAVVSFTNTDAEVYRLINIFKRTIGKIRSVVNETSNDVLRKKFPSVSRGDGAGGGIEPVPGPSGAGTPAPGTPGGGLTPEEVAETLRQAQAQ